MKNLFPMKIYLWISAGLILLSALSFGADEAVRFDPEHWQLGPATRVEEFLGRKALTLSGTAFLKDVVFENGIVEVDLAFKEGTIFPTIIFRAQDEANYEEFYVRPHKSGQPDALQYTPVFNGLSAWQLYYGEGYTRAWTFSPNTWIHIKLEIAGTQARVFIGGAPNPALVINDLKRGRSKGRLGLKVTGTIGLSYFADFTYRTDDSLVFDPPVKIETPFGMITEWELSQSFPYNLLDNKRYPLQDQWTKAEWKSVASEPTGLINVSRYVRKGPVLPGIVMARTRIHAGEEKSMELQFGYSDVVSIFLNGRLLFYGLNLYQLRDPFFQGRVGLFDSVYLPLKKGDNELLLLLAESMGGWGFMCRVGDAVYLDKSLTKLWELSNKLSYPETVLYDKARNVLYVSNLYTDGAQFISKVSLDGEIEEFEWIKGLIQPTGMAIYQDKLFVVERANLVEVDIPSGQIVKKHAAPSPGFMNDIAADSEGNLYISDGRKGQILKFSNGQFSTWKSGSELVQINGLHYSDGKLYVGFSLDASLRSIDLKTGEIRTVVQLSPGAIVDGIETDENGNILVSDFNGKIFLVRPEGQISLLLDSTAPKQYCANFAYVAGENLLIVPTLADNRIIAFKRSPK
ncbi:MAG: SMP-30/gluconolactonase/LRE family protein [Candidatus Aminicenantales bacterium]